MSANRRTPVAITIAGSDSGGGAGIQADLKAFARSGVHGTSAIVALTAQNTVGVTSIHPVPPPMILEQVRAVSSDIGVDAVKVGMLGDEGTIAAVVEAIGELGEVPVVVDPVMVAESRAVLLDPAAKAALIERVLPLATVATPNLPEAAELTGMGEGSDPEDLARAVHALGPANVVVTGGHSDQGTDYFFDGATIEPIPGPRHAPGATHGSGCTHSSALAAHMALGMGAFEAAREARRIAAEAVASGLHDLGSGPGPVDVLGIAQRRPA
jgi:hydroxymethylpyrimidine/phosphomethylpyrimidine kinase